MSSIGSVSPTKAIARAACQNTGIIHGRDQRAKWRSRRTEREADNDRLRVHRSLGQVPRCEADQTVSQTVTTHLLPVIVRQTTMFVSCTPNSTWRATSMRNPNACYTEVSSIYITWFYRVVDEIYVCMRDASPPYESSLESPRTSQSLCYRSLTWWQTPGQDAHRCESIDRL